MRYLSACIKTRKNNLDFIRFFAASLVIISHAFPLSTGTDKRELMVLLTHDQLTLGRFAVAVFFIISGFLITASYDRSQNIKRFVRARFLRIFPGLAVVVLLTAFVLGPMVTSMPLAEYLHERQTCRYLGTMFLRNSDALPGVFVSNPFPNAVNGSLWTLFFEVLCYCIVAVMGIVGLLKRRPILILFLLVMIAPLPASWTWHRWHISTMLAFTKLFASGMLCYAYRDHIRLSKWLAVAALVGLLVSTQLGGLDRLLPILGTYLVMYCAFTPCGNLWSFAKRGDFSYGMYIYAFPIQQTVMLISGGRMSPIFNMLISFPFVLLFAALSWHIIEKKCLKRKTAVKASTA
ncbi:acyltransferase [bacterium]|nr:acyltransferase [bacterium]